MNASLHPSPAPTQGAEAAPSSDYAVDARRISKWFPTPDGESLLVLKDVSFSVERGKIAAILGASGCGKSTLLNIVSGLLAPDRGEVFLNGIASREFRQWRSIAYMFQEDRLLPWRTAIDNVAFGLEAGDIPRAERMRRARETLQLVGLEGFENAYPYQLSGGMRSRVALARSLVVEPMLLLMDEPFSKLDPMIRSQMHAELLRIQALKGVTVVFVTHDVDEAVVLADHVTVLMPRPGRVKAVVPIDLPRPREQTRQDVIEYVRELRTMV